MADDDITVPQLDHLERCRKCAVGWLTVDYMCKEGSVPTNKNCWYRLCLNKLGPSPLKCNYFRWRDDIPCGKASNPNAAKLCPGYICTHGRGSRKVNAECMLGLCQQCCVHVHLTIIGTPWCRCTKHAHATEQRPAYSLPEHALLPVLMYPPHFQPADPSSLQQPGDEPSTPSPAESSSTGDQPPMSSPPRGPGPSPRLPPRGQGRPPAARGQRPLPGGGVRGPLSVSSTLTNETAGAACLGSNHRGSYAVSISPIYDYTLVQAQMIEQQRVEQASMAKQVGHTIRTIDIFWWDENGKAARHVRVHVPQDPWFHPRDSDHLVKRFGLKDGVFFQFYDWRKDGWLDAGFDSVPLHVDLCGELHYRSNGVTWGPDMPGSSPPRTSPTFNPALFGLPASTESLLKTPTSRALGKRPMDVVVDLTVDEHWDDVSVPGSTPTATTGSNNGPVESSLFGSYRGSILTTPSTVRSAATPTSSRFSTPSSSVSDLSTPSIHGRSSTPSFVGDWAALTVAGPASTAPPLGSSSTSTSDDGLDLGPAPRGNSKSGWPWLYACDMIAGFKAMAALSRTKVNQPQAFSVAFAGQTFVRATFAENYQAFTQAQAHPGEIARWSQLGRQDAGTWSEFRKQWGRKCHV